ncbi:MAG: Ig-like domain-containing protein [Oscillospiraceae bacterium]
MKRKTAGVIGICFLMVLTLGIVKSGAMGKGDAPIAENFEITTYREVSIGGKLKATDPDGDVLSYVITTHPTKGEIELSDTGSFVYTPNDGKRGRDYFGYKAVDGRGNESSEATVIIKIEKQKSKMTYSDMKGNASHCAAIALAENNIFVGECIGGQYVFNPNAPVSRGEFLTMCLKLTNFDILSGVITTGFADDGAIPSYMKPYVSTALLSGVITGYSDEMNTSVFNGTKFISYPEAAVMLNKTLNLSDVSVKDSTSAAPAWATQACANLDACRISDSADVGAEVALTRADCAKLLAGAQSILENR